MLFSVNPKESVSELYDRKRELAELSSAVKRDERLSIVYGMRRVGKTSLVHAFLSQKEIPSALIDVREVYVEHGSVPRGILYEKISNAFLEFATKFGSETEDSISSRYPTFFESIELVNLLKDINDWCKNKKVVFAIVFDEAQYLRFGGSIKYDMLLAWSVDNLSNIFYVLTGSEVGMLKDFMKYEDVKAPLYGRFRNEVYLNNFNEKTAGDFLSAGFGEFGKKISDNEIRDVLEELGGIVGWLTYYGHYRCTEKMGHRDAMAAVYKEGSKMTLAELESLLFKSRARYFCILEAIAKELDSWSDIKTYVEVKSGRISDTRFARLLGYLVKFGFVEKEGTDYKLADPILKRAIKTRK